MPEERIRPFYCGTQYVDWTSANCDRCKVFGPELYSTPCEIANALADASWDDGTVSKEIADRMGFTRESYNWKCGEFVPPAVAATKRD